MATVNKAVLGNITGTIGNITGSEWKGIPYVRSKATTVNQPKTAAQMTARLRFTMFSQWIKLFNNHWTKQMWDKQSKQMSGINNLLKKNIIKFDQDNKIQFNKILMSEGKLAQIQNATIENDTVTVTNQPEDPYGNQDDQIYALIIENETGNYVWSGNTGLKRNTPPETETEIEIPLPEQYSIWLSYKDTNSSKTSNSLFTTNGKPGTACLYPTQTQINKNIPLKGQLNLPDKIINTQTAPTISTAPKKKIKFRAGHEIIK